MPTRSERRRTDEPSLDSARILEINLDRYPTKPAMLTYLQSLLYAAEANDMGPWQVDYVVALTKAIDALEDSPSPVEAAATLQGYRSFISEYASRHDLVPCS
jgi:hypothetical protein